VELRSFLPEAASVGNPVDMLASAPPEHYRLALAALLADGNVDSVLTIFIPPLVTDPDAVAAQIAAAAGAATDKPILGIFMRSEGAPPGLTIPCYAFPESAAIALARVTAHGEWRRKPIGAIPALADVSDDRGRAIVEGALTRGGGWLTSDETQRLMAAVGISTAAARLTTNVDAAVAAAVAIGFPVAVKAVAPTILHKTERQAVRLDLRDAAAVRAAAVDFEERFRGELSGLLVQQMIAGGVEMLVGAVHDPTFGPVVVCGSGGVFVDLLGDSAFRIHPVTSDDAAEMIRELKGARLLRGYRGAPAADETALRDVILRVSALLTMCPEIMEIDLNPVKVLASGAAVVDARIRVERQHAPARTRRVEY
jgi:acyl-CoA synthetase (NDP forming)